MNKQLKQKQIDALTSGEYSQTRQVLCNSEGYCCLGVLADIVDPNKWVSATKYDFGDSVKIIYPSNEWLNHIGLPIDICSSLAHRNDAGDSFGVIAKYISEMVPEDD